MQAERHIRWIAVALLLCATSAVKAQSAADSDSPWADRLAACTGCHGARGEGGDNGFNPRLAGKPAAYLARQLRYFHDGLRRYPIMEYTVRGLTPDYRLAIANYFASQDVPYRTHPAPTSETQRQRGETLALKGDAARGIPACIACHGERLTGVQPDIPGLIGLPYDYISAQFGSWRTRTRAMDAPDCMADITRRLTDGDISAVAGYLATRPIPDDPHPQATPSAERPLRCGALGR